MAKWKLMTKRIALAVLTAAMLMGPATNAFAHSNENAESSETTEAAETSDSTETESTSSADLVLEETDTSEEDTGETIDRSSAFSVAGNAEVQDDITDDFSKEFLTIVTKNNQTFYVIIDRSSTTDNVYMLSNIDEDDLQEFLTEVSDGEEETETATVILPEKSVTEDEAETADADDEEADQEESKDDTVQNAGMAGILVVALGALAAGYYFKIYKPKHSGVEDAPNEGLEDAEDYDEVDEDEE